MVDKSWGNPASARPTPRAAIGPEQRAAERARARDQRAAEREGSISSRLEARAATREALMVEREAARTARREEEMKRAAADPHAANAERHRGSGRKDLIKKDRDTTGYTMLVDDDRIRKLAARGASAASLAAVLGLPIEEIERALATPTPD